MVVTPIRPVVAPAGTVTVSCESESTENSVAATFLKVTIVVWVRLTPVITTDVPGEAPAGLKPTICGFTRNFLLLVSVPVGVVTVTRPLVAPPGTVAVRNVSETTVNAAGVPLKETAVAPVKP